MSLQRRLTLVFILIVILPLAAAGFIVQRLVVDEIARRAVISLGPSLDAAVLIYNNRAEVIDERVRAAVGVPRFGKLLESRDQRPVGAFLAEKVRSTEGLDFLIALDRKGRPLGTALSGADFLGSFETPGLRQIMEREVAGPGFNRTAEIPVNIAGRGRVGGVIGGFWLDQEFLVSPQSDVNLSIATGGRIIASTANLDHPARVDIPPDRATFDLRLDGRSQGKARPLDGDMAVVASTPRAPITALSRKVLLSMALLLLGALLVTTALAYLLARLITQPLEELAEGAQAISEGRFDRKIRVRSRDEVGQLASAFNDMTGRLRDTVTELSSSRDQMRRTVRRVGETLRSTHDMNQMLDSIVNMASDAVRAHGAMLWRFTSTREELYPAIARGIEIDPNARIRVGEGTIGLVAERGTTVRLPRTRGAPHAAPSEPTWPVAAAIPLYSSQDRILGVLAVYRQSEEMPFTEEDLDTLVFLTEQGGVAIENVLLHEEAQRLSLTDGLTGVWNRRYYQMQFKQVLATATRFGRPFSVLMLDLDHFKNVNDMHGHQRGDEVLVEFTQRVKSALREVDTLARYGGEEFICLLAETDMDGARTTADKILDVIRSAPFGTNGEAPIHITVSIGIATHPEHGDSFERLVKSADQALYRAKGEGRDRACTAVTPGSPPSLKLAN